jgi:spectinomycin phosphotransferase
LPGDDRDRLVDMLAALHGCAAAALAMQRASVTLPWRDDLEAALTELGDPWSGGPLSDYARALLAAWVTRIRRLLVTFDALADHVRALETVVTHGEPHPANLMAAGTETMLIDWDTVGAAPPERDLWWIVRDSGHVAARRCAEATGRPVDRDALEFYPAPVGARRNVDLHARTSCTASPHRRHGASMAGAEDHRREPGGLTLRGTARANPLYSC